jgi:hypothetical protein
VPSALTGRRLRGGGQRRAGGDGLEAEPREPSRAGASIAVIRPSTTVKASTATGSPASVRRSRSHRRRSPDARRAWPRRPRAGRHRPSALDDRQRAAAAVGAQHDVGVWHREQTLEVASEGGSQERVDDLPVSRGRVAARAVDAAPRP